MGLSWHDKILAQAEQQEEDLRYAEEQQAMVARAAASRQASPQSAPSADAGRKAALDKAVGVAGALAAQSGGHPGVAWAVGIYKVAGATAVFATSNEGMGYIPSGVKWDSPVRLVFDPAAPPDIAMSWHGPADPARVVAEHFLRLSAARRDVELLGVASTRPVGEHVAAFLGERGALMAERMAPSHSPQDGVCRAEAVLPGVLGHARGLAWWQRRQAATALLRDAAALTDLRRTCPEVHGMIGALEAGRVDWGAVAFVEEWGRYLTGQAQLRLVPEDRLGPVSAGRQDASTVLPSGGAWSYAGPFYAARVCAMLAIMLRAVVADQALSAEDLADIAYEHYCVSEDLDATRRLLAQGVAGGEHQTQGGWG